MAVFPDGGTVDLYLGLGTNIGDRELNIRRALEALDEALGGHFDALSEVVETEPWGFDCQDRFLNAVVRYVVNVPRGTSAADFGLEVLHRCKGIEAAMGRTGQPEYAPDGSRIYRSRIIDIDILLIGDERIDEPELKVPHPLMGEREFVMGPLRQVLRNCSVCQRKFLHLQD